ncbi:TAP42 [Malassezia furfur]|nr:TAP42 [Malassezia furfur]
MAVLAYIGFYHAWVPDASVHKDVHLQFRHGAEAPPPFAHVLLDGSDADVPVWQTEPSAPLFREGITYDVALEMRVLMPHGAQDSTWHADTDAMVRLELAAGDTPMYAASRAVLLVPEPRVVRWGARLARSALRPFQREPVVPTQVPPARMSDAESLTGRLDTAARLASARRDVPHALALLADVARAADALGVVSANEPLREIPTHALRVFFVPSLQAYLEDARPTPPDAPEGDRMHARKQHVEACVGAARLFFTTATKHGALPPAVALMLRQQVLGHAQLAPAERRHLKIQLLKIEKEVVRLLDAFRSEFRARAYQKQPHAPRPPALDDAFFDLLVVPSGDEGAEEEEEEEEDDDDTGAGDARRGADTFEARPPRTLRDYLRMLLVLHAVRTAGTMDAARQELEMLQHARRRPGTTRARPTRTSATPPGASTRRGSPARRAARCSARAASRCARL